MRFALEPQSSQDRSSQVLNLDSKQSVAPPPRHAVDGRRAIDDNEDRDPGGLNNYKNVSKTEISYPMSLHTCYLAGDLANTTGSYARPINGLFSNLTFRQTCFFIIFIFGFEFRRLWMGCFVHYVCDTGLCASYGFPSDSSVSKLAAELILDNSCDCI